MNFTFTHFFNCDTRAFEEFTHRSDPGEYLAEMPNLRQRELEVERMDGRYVHRVYRNFASGYIPKEIRRLVKPKMLSWLEESTYDIVNKTFEWNVRPHYFSDVFVCRGTYAYIDEGPGRMRREMKGELKVKAPVVGEVAERYIFKRLKENLEMEYRITSRIVERGLNGREASSGEAPVPADMDTD